MKPVLLAFLTVLIMLCMQMAVAAPHWYESDVAWVYGRDLVLLTIVVVLLANTRLSRVSVWISAFLGWCVMVYEWVRAVGTEAMSQEPLLYDALFLGKHLYILMRDLMGTQATQILAGLVGVLLVSFVLFRLGFGAMAALSRSGGWLHLVMVSLLLAGSVRNAESTTEPITGMDTLADAQDNIVRSQQVWSKLQQGLDDQLYTDIASLKLKKKPRVHIYVIESYGRASLRPTIKVRYREFLSGIGKRMSKAGWKLATGLSEAPVMGGRSWLADATLLSGIQIRYESEFRHLTPLFSEMTTLPGFFRRRGYDTVLMRPKDTARPGVELVNHFNYNHTVFSKDLAYTGTPYGWVETPDQYALGHIRDEVMPGLDGPEFIFAHLASSHIPWDDLPPIVEDWRTLGGEQPQKDSGKHRALNEAQIRFQLERFKRKDEVRVRRLRPTAENVDEYLEAVMYSIEVTIQHIEAMTDPPDLVVVLGDHQPPLYKKNKDFTVPVHVFARNGRLLAEFRENGFSKGIQPRSWDKRIYHEGFFSLMIRALASAEGAEVPKYRARGNHDAAEIPVEKK
jgi:hypothetical protein